MPLPLTGEITLSQVAEEFRQPTNKNIDLDAYKRGAGIVKTIPKNMQVPTVEPIGLDNLHYSRYYFMQVTFNITSETGSPPYFTANDGRVSVGVVGVSNNYSVKLGTVTSRLFSNSTAQFNNLDSGDYPLIVSDVENLTNYYFTVHVGVGSGSYTSYSRLAGYTSYFYGDGGSYVKDISNQRYTFQVPYMIG